MYMLIFSDQCFLHCDYAIAFVFISCLSCSSPTSHTLSWFKTAKQILLEIDSPVDPHLFLNDSNMKSSEQFGTLSCSNSSSATPSLMTDSRTAWDNALKQLDYSFVISHNFLSCTKH